MKTKVLNPAITSTLNRKIILPVVAGLLAIGIFFGVFGYWAVSAQIAGAAIADGVIGTENARRSVQHFEGGVIRKIHVRDGEEVKAGQSLIVLDDTNSRALLEAQRVSEAALKVRRHRLETEMALYLEKQRSGELNFPEEIRDLVRSLRSAPTLLAVEKRRFDSRMQALASALEIQEQTEGGYHVEIDGLRSEVESLDAQLAVFAKENNLFAGLRKKGLELQSRVLQSQRATVQLEQQKIERLSRIAKLQESIKSTRLKIRDLWVVRMDEVSTELATISQEILTVAQTIESYADILQRTVIRSPVDGTLISLAVNTEGGVLAPGATAVEIVPSGDPLTIEARVKPTDIDVVRAGQKSTVTLLAYPQRNLPKIYGVVRSVSADSLYDSDQNESYYLAKVDLQDNEAEKLGDGIKLLPGMTVQVMIQTTSRTFFDYVTSPVIRSAERAFSEQ